MNILQWLKDWWRGIPLGGMARSKNWREVRAANIKKFCEVCGKKGALLKPLELHHVLPFHIAPELELLSENLFTACRDCHFKFCHLTDFKSWNEHVREDAAAFQVKVQNRPYGQ